MLYMTPERTKPDVKREISAGVVLYRATDEGVKFLILYHRHNYWNFPKGKIESEERSMEAALRETEEETGISRRAIRLHQNFRAHERFTFRREGEQIYKIVIFYLGETRAADVKIATREANGYGWFLYSEARKVLGKYRDSQRVLRHAYEFLKGPTKQPNHQSNEKHEAKQGRRRPHQRGNIHGPGAHGVRPHSPWQGGNVRRDSQGHRGAPRVAGSGERAQ